MGVQEIEEKYSITSPLQVINLVTPDSIEQEMLGKLRFKTSMFEGVLDDGEDSVFILSLIHISFSSCAARVQSSMKY